MGDEKDVAEAAGRIGMSDSRPHTGAQRVQPSALFPAGWPDPGPAGWVERSEDERRRGSSQQFRNDVERGAACLAGLRRSGRVNVRLGAAQCSVSPRVAGGVDPMPQVGCSVVKISWGWRTMRWGGLRPVPFGRLPVLACRWPRAFPPDDARASIVTPTAIGFRHIVTQLSPAPTSI